MRPDSQITASIVAKYMQKRSSTGISQRIETEASFNPLKVELVPGGSQHGEVSITLEGDLGVDILGFALRKTVGATVRTNGVNFDVPKFEAKEVSDRAVHDLLFGAFRLLVPKVVTQLQRAKRLASF